MRNILVTLMTQMNTNCYYLRNQQKVYFHVYRLEEYGGLLKEGGVRLTVLALRTRSYKNKAEAWQQGFAPILFKVWMSVFVNRNNTDEHRVDNQRNQRNLRA